MSSDRKKDANGKYLVEIKKKYLCLIEEDDSNKVLHIFARYRLFILILKLNNFHNFFKKFKRNR